MAVKFNVPQLNAIRSDDQYTAEAFDVLIEQISAMQQQIEQLQSAVQTLQNASA